MRKIFLPLTAIAALAGMAQPALAQNGSTDTSAQMSDSDSVTGFRGIRVEGNFGGDRFQSNGKHDDHFGYGATVGFDGTIGQKIVIGPEASYWRSSHYGENCGGLSNGDSTCDRSFHEWGAAVRVGYLPRPDLLLFAKGGYVNSGQDTRLEGPTGAQLAYSKSSTDGYQVGGGVEYTVTHGRLPVYVNAQYVYSNYDNHTSRQRVMGGIGVRFK